MTCTQYDERLALLVEGDLAPAETHAMQAHLDVCVRCRAFLRELESSQGQLKALAYADVDAPSLAVLRDRVERELRGSRPRRALLPAVAWRWALAASLLAVAWFAYRLAEPRSLSGRVKTAALPQSPAPAVLARSTAPVPAPAQEAHSTPRVAAKVSVRKGHAPAYGLSEDDADQLARAVVALARVGQEPVAKEREHGTDAGPLVRIVTADPDVVIYWQLDSNGG